jgi:hypothetical protein
MARRSQLLARKGHRIGSNQHRVKVLSNVYLDQQQASTRSLLHFRFAINNGHAQERSEYPKVPGAEELTLTFNHLVGARQRLEQSQRSTSGAQDRPWESRLLSASTSGIHSWN